MNENIRTKAGNYFNNKYPLAESPYKENAIIMLADFHAQQLEKDNWASVSEVLIKAKTALEYCRNNGLSVLFCDETIHEIDVFLNVNQ